MIRRDTDQTAIRKFAGRLARRGARSPVNLAELQVATDALGPGRRAIVWVQGCPRRCSGCASPAMLSFDVDGEWIEPHALAERILGLGPLEGVTFSGGEPFAAAAGLAATAAILRRRADLSVVTYTGYQLADLVRRAKPAWRALLAVTDLLIDGPYVAGLAGDLLWRGSANQRLHFLSDRYRAAAGRIADARGGPLELIVGADRAITIVGIPPRDLMARLQRSLAAAGVVLRDADAHEPTCGAAR